MAFMLLISCMYLKLTILLPSWEVGNKKMDITFVGNSQNIAFTTSLPNISLAARIKKTCLTNVKTKLKLYENLKSIKLLTNCTKETSILPVTQKSRF